LSRSERPIAAVAQACGFETLSNFNVQFRRRHGMNPGAFRRERRLA
jgi:AraC-like DNA-binding protein